MVVLFELHRVSARLSKNIALISSDQCHEATASWGKNIPVTKGQRRIVEKRWCDFFTDPSQWWDSRPEKVNSRYPDFKHKTTKESLWLNGKSNPPWVEAELAAMAPGTVQVDHFTWNKRLARCVKAGQYEKTMGLFQEMKRKGMNPDKFTFVPVLNACSSLQALGEGIRVHVQIKKSGFESDIFVNNSLVDMYANCGSIGDARRVFDKMPRRDVVTWNAMILAYVRCSEGQMALELFQWMCQEGVAPSPVTFLAVLNACASLTALEDGRDAHKQAIQSGCESDIFVASSLVDMYTKCGSMEEAQAVFNKMPKWDVVAWNAMILGYAKFGQGQKALELYRRMQQEGQSPDPLTFVGLLNACASLLALEEGRHVHDHVVRSGCESDTFVANSIINMYSKCGSIGDARGVFNKMLIRDIVSWNAMLGGYAMHGHAKEALGHLEWMSQEGVEMDGVTFVSILSACSHGGLVEEGLHYFELMKALYTFCPIVDHYACIVNLLGRAGRLHEAEDLIKMMSCEPNTSVWISLLGACRVHVNVEIGERAAKRILELDPKNAAGHVLLSNIYAAAGKWDSSAKVHQQRLEE